MIIRTLRSLGHYAKAAEAVVGCLLRFGTLVASTQGLLPASLAKDLGAILVAMTTFRVFLTANAKKIDELGDQAADELEKTREA